MWTAPGVEVAGRDEPAAALAVGVPAALAEAVQVASVVEAEGQAVMLEATASVRRRLCRT